MLSNLEVPEEWEDENITLKDYTAEVGTLFWNKDCVYKSTKLDVFERTRKISFLRMTDTGLIILDVFKPGCHNQTQLSVSEDVMSEIKKHALLTEFAFWAMSASWKSGEDGSTTESSMSDALFSFTKEIQILPNKKLVWKWKHRNPKIAGGAFVLEDTLTLVDC